MKTTRNRIWKGIPGLGAIGLGILSALTLSVAACDFTVTNPGRITEDALADSAAANVILVGLVADIENAMDEMSLDAGLASDEMNFSGTRSWYDFFAKGDPRSSDTGVDWDPAATARWSSEEGVKRLEAFNASDPRVGEAHVWAGFMLRAMGDLFCQATFDGGPAEPDSAYYDRAAGHFQAALSSNAPADYITAANAGMAQVDLILGKYAEAATYAANVPDDFVFVVHYSDVAGENNLIWFETIAQTQATVYGTPIADLGPDGDPRTPWQDAGKLGAGGVVPFYQQLKYDERGSDIPFAKGWEMRLIEAEVLLRQGDVSGAMAKINYVRNNFGVTPATAAAADEAWAALDHERLVTLWLEGRRLKDNARFFAEGHNDFLQGRATCFPFSDAEINSNENLP